MHAPLGAGDRNVTVVYDEPTYKRTRWYRTPWPGEVHGWLFPNDEEPFGVCDSASLWQRIMASSVWDDLP